MSNTLLCVYLFRMVRHIDDVIGTSDGHHVLALCTDGGVLYYQSSTSPNTSSSLNTTSLWELDLKKNSEIDQAWMMRRVGVKGDILLLRALKSTNKRYTILQVDKFASKSISFICITIVSIG